MDVPSIDIGPFLAGDPAGKRQVARRIDEACEGIGFFVITGHGVPGELVAAMSEVSRQFFDLDEAEKLQCTPPTPGVARGYSRMKAENLAYSTNKVTPPDLKEAFSIGQVDVPDADYFRSPAAAGAFAPNIWPARPARFAAIWSEYYQLMERLACDIMRMFAVALDLPEHFFRDALDRHVSVLRALNYPAPDTAPLPGQLRAGEHTDFGSLTILLQEDKPGGLQVLTRGGEWLDVHPEADSFTINIGDLMQVWTNDRWVSNLHRVANPRASSAAESRRQSIAFFQQPNYDALVSCLESCRSAAQPPRYRPVTSGAHMRMKITRSTTLVEQPRG